MCSSGLVRHGLGGTQGPGTQFVSWIHEADFVRAIDLLIAREEFDGRRQSRFAQSAAQSRLHASPARGLGHRASACPRPGWIIGIGTLLMRTESELVLKSRRVVPGRLLSPVSSFSFPNGLPPPATWSPAGALLYCGRL